MYYFILGPLTKNEESMIINTPLGNVNQQKKATGKMLKSTQDMLREFYYPFNKQLYEILGDERFLWNDIYKFEK